jgi:hypothetical protein
VTPIDPARVAELTERERARLAERRPRSIRFPSGLAGMFMPFGDPRTISIAHRERPGALGRAFDAFATAVTA